MHTADLDNNRTRHGVNITGLDINRQNSDINTAGLDIRIQGVGKDLVKMSRNLIYLENESDHRQMKNKLWRLERFALSLNNENNSDTFAKLITLVEQQC